MTRNVVDKVPIYFLLSFPFPFSISFSFSVPVTFLIGERGLKGGWNERVKIGVKKEVKWCVLSVNYSTR